MLLSICLVLGLRLGLGDLARVVNADERARATCRTPGRELLRLSCLVGLGVLGCGPFMLRLCGCAVLKL